MPAIVGNIKINAVSSSSILQVGDAFYVSPYAIAKTFSGAGSFNTGNYTRTVTNMNITRTYDRDDVDQNILII